MDYVFTALIALVVGLGGGYYVGYKMGYLDASVVFGTMALDFSNQSLGRINKGLDKVIAATKVYDVKIIEENKDIT